MYLSGMNSSCYFGFGLNIRSELALPELVPISSQCWENNPGINIFFGDVNEIDTEAEGVLKNKYIEKTKSSLVFTVENVGRFGIYDGSVIIIEKKVEASANTIRLFLLGSCMGFLLQQRGIYALHSSGVVNKAGNAILFLGASGAGKSTICRHLVNEGYKYIGDDTLPITRNAEGEFLVIPSYPQSKLWHESLEILDVQSSEIKGRIRPKIDKYRVVNKEDYFGTPLKIQHAFVLSWSFEENDFVSKLLNPIKAVTVFRNQAYRGRTLLFKNEEVALLELSVKLAEKIPLTRISRGRGVLHTIEIQKLIE